MILNVCNNEMELIFCGDLSLTKTTDKMRWRTCVLTSIAGKVQPACASFTLNLSKFIHSSLKNVSLHVSYQNISFFIPPLRAVVLTTQATEQVYVICKVMNYNLLNKQQILELPLFAKIASRISFLQRVTEFMSLAIKPIEWGMLHSLEMNFQNF